MSRMDIEFYLHCLIPVIISEAGTSPPSLDGPHFVHLQLLLATTVISSTKLPNVIRFLRGCFVEDFNALPTETWPLHLQSLL